MAEKEMVNYLIIGNSAGGIGAVEAIRGVDKSGSVAVVSDEPYPVYSRPLIAEHLAHGCSLERMLFRPPDFYEKSNARTLFGEKVMQVDFNEHVVKLAGNRTLTWRKLLLATGGSPIIPKMEGIGLRGVFTFTRLDDAKAIDRLLNQYQRQVKAVVIGGGLIGVSAVEALLKRDVEVTVVEMKERILNAILDEEASALEEKILQQIGVTVITNHTVSRIDGDLPGEAAGVILDDSRLIPCDMVVIAIGVQPRIELVSDSGIKTNRGIVVNRHMATSMPDVYACGDVAEAYDFVYDENRLTPVWPNAYLGGRFAGLNMAGTPAKYQGGTAVNAMKYFGVNIVSAGMVAPPDDSYETVSVKQGDVYKKVIVKEGLIAGMVFAGDIEKSGIVYNLMKDRVNVNDFKEALVADDFGLASLPEEIWRDRLAIAPSALTSLPASVEQPDEVLVGE